MNGAWLLREAILRCCWGFKESYRRIAIVCGIKCPSSHRLGRYAVEESGQGNTHSCPSLKCASLAPRSVRIGIVALYTVLT